MKRSCTQIKASARQSLLGHYGVVIAALILSELITLLLDIPFSRMTNQGITYMVVSRIILGSFGSLIVSLISILLGTGIARIHLQIARKQETSIKEILYPFQNRPDKYIGFSVLTLAISVICEIPGIICLVPVMMQAQHNSSYSPLFLITGFILLIIGLIILVIIMLSWTLTTYILLDNVDIRVTDAIRQSRNLMKGNKWRLCKLYLSFVGWAILGILSFFIGFLWILPYISHSLVWFYLDFLPEPAEKATLEN